MLQKIAHPYLKQMSSTITCNNSTSEKCYQYVWRVGHIDCSASRTVKKWQNIGKFIIKYTNQLRLW